MHKQELQRPILSTLPPESSKPGLHIPFSWIAAGCKHLKGFGAGHSIMNTAVAALMCNTYGPANSAVFIKNRTEAGVVSQRGTGCPRKAMSIALSLPRPTLTLNIH